MSTLQATIHALATEFVHDLMLAVRRASLEDLTAMRGNSRAPRAAAAAAAPRGNRGNKRIRRSPAELEAFAEKIIAEVKRHKDGMRAEDLKRAMGVRPGNIGAKVFTIPLGIALQSRKIKKRGARRATTYFAP